MTCCVGVVAEHGKSLVLVGDGEVNLDWVAAEPEVQKIEEIAPSWWACFSGTISSCLALIDEAKDEFAKKKDVQPRNTWLYRASSVKPSSEHTSPQEIKKPRCYICALAAGP